MATFVVTQTVSLVRGVPNGQRGKTSTYSGFVCIQSAWSKRDFQISTWNYKRDKARITKKLGEYAANRIDTYMEESKVS